MGRDTRNRQIRQRQTILISAQDSGRQNIIRKRKLCACQSFDPYGLSAVQ